MGALLVLPVVACLVLAVAAAILPPVRVVAAPAGAVVVLASGVALAVVALGGSTPVAFGGLLRSDALSAFMLSVVGAVGLTTTWGGRVGRSEASGASAPALVCLFLGAMSLAVVADNLGVLWVAVEATTITTAFLVGHQRSRRSVEAAWKYVVLASMGVAIAFLGVVLLYAATLPSGEPTLSWSQLVLTPPSEDPALVRVAAGLLVLGFATKAGLAPLHSWLPDAHSQAPAPVSGLMSGVLLAVAFYAVLRVQAVVDPVIGTGLVRGLLVVSGLLSLAVSAALILRQRDLKRMLAYSSIEHMGLLALAAAIGGPLATSAALLHVLGHGLAKSSAFVSSGRILESEGTTRMAAIRALLARRPGVAVPFLLGMAALLGFPPFSLFFSEVAIVVAGVRAGLGAVMAVAVVLLLLLFAGIVRHTAALLFGAAADDDVADSPPDTGWYGPRTPLLLALAITAVIGLVTGPFATLLLQAATVLEGTR